MTRVALGCDVDFGVVLKLLRMGAGVGVRQLASEIGVSSAYISRVEHGHDAPPTTDRLVEIARVLKIPPDVLLELSGHLTPAVTRYLARVPSANALFVEIARRDLNAAQITQLRQILDREFPRPEAARHPSLSSALAPDRVVVGLDCTSIQDAIEVAAIKLAPRVGLAAVELARQMIAREEDCPSGIGDGVALPHLTSDALTSTAAVVITLVRGLRAHGRGEVPVRLIFAFAGPDRPPGVATRLLASAARLAKCDSKDRLLRARDPQEVLAVLHEHELIFG